jgi:GNAT superfamily N-acetyltransferase
MGTRAAGSGLEEREVTLRDGTRALVRPIRPDDKERLQKGLQLLSPRSRYLRFHTPVDHLTEAQLRYLTEIDYHDHMAWVALNPDEPDEPGMGVGRYVRLREDPTIAEAAVTVLDRYQGRGLGTILLQLLAASAAENGIRTFRNYVLAENRTMLDLLDEVGASRVDEGSGVYRIDVPLPEEPSRQPGRAPQRILREAAQGMLGPFRFVFPLSAFRRARAKGDDPGRS